MPRRHAREWCSFLSFSRGSRLLLGCKNLHMRCVDRWLWVEGLLKRGGVSFGNGGGLIDPTAHMQICRFRAWVFDSMTFGQSNCRIMRELRRLQSTPEQQ